MNKYYLLPLVTLLFGCQSIPKGERLFCISADDKNQPQFEYFPTPISRVAPRYPTTAEKDGVEGFVKFKFDVSKNGKPVNINIVESYPGTVFNLNSKQALKKWKYKPAKFNGESIHSSCYELTLNFQLNYLRVKNTPS
ncbi:energy transducer TonB [Catenovulum adriaticum]|uniref:Protein TonB n=1 Tax=Catenovulum adriaticum TaxID=2984846 RepID=A0ABY7AHR3_9ALTE|nr:energy transducer TonB [Catenovulum sp. TS8]WAJ69157.1 energy transducer TonB [Catenovulum sp. TS8]